MILTKEQIEEIKARADVATPGPFTVGQYTSSENFKAIENHSCVCEPDRALIALCGRADDLQSQRDSDFFSAARTDIPALIESHESLRADKEMLARMLEVARKRREEFRAQLNEARVEIESLKGVKAG